jgi:hypothetical protein
MEIREQRPADAGAVRRLLTDAFADDGTVANLAAALLARPDRPARRWWPTSTARSPGACSCPGHGSTRRRSCSSD